MFSTHCIQKIIIAAFTLFDAAIDLFHVELRSVTFGRMMYKMAIFYDIDLNSEKV